MAGKDERPGSPPRHSRKTPASGNRSGTPNGTESVADPQGDESDDPFGGAIEPKRRGPRVVARYTYTDENGDKLFQVRRWEPKRFTQHGWTGTRYVSNVRGVRRVIYRLPEVLAAVANRQPVWIVEGEKDVHTLEDLGHVATCSPGGAGKWRAEFNDWFRGANAHVVMDWDDPGRSHALSIYEGLTSRGVRVKLHKATAGKDVTDHVQSGGEVSGMLTVSDLYLRSLVRTTEHPTTIATVVATSPEVPLVLHTLVGLLAGYGPVTRPAEPSRDWTVCCPVHGDRVPSATLSVGATRPVVFRCHTGCSQEDFLAWAKAQGVPIVDLMDWKRPFAGELSEEMQAVVAEVQRVMGSLGDRDFDHLYDELIDDAGLENEPDPEWVVPGWFERHGYTVLYAPAGTGKTAIAIGAAETVGQGRHSWLNVQPEQGAVMFLSGEGRAQLKVRRRTFLEEMGWSPGGATKLYGTARDLETAVGVASVVHNVRRLEAESVEKVQLIVVDPLNEFSSADENGDGMHNVSRGLRALAIVTDTAVLVGHHTNAAGEVERGSTVLRNRALAMIQMQKINDDTVALIQTKQKNAEEIAAVFMRCGDRRGITFRLLEAMPRHQYEQAVRERVEETKRVTRSRKDAVDYEEMRKLLVGWFEKNPDGGTASRITRRGGLLGNGFGDDKLRQVLTQMVSKGEVEQDGEGHGAVYRLRPEK